MNLQAVVTREMRDQLTKIESKISNLKTQDKYFDLLQRSNQTRLCQFLIMMELVGPEGLLGFPGEVEFRRDDLYLKKSGWLDTFKNFTNSFPEVDPQVKELIATLYKNWRTPLTKASLIKKIEHKLNDAKDSQGTWVYSGTVDDRYLDFSHLKTHDRWRFYLDPFVESSTQVLFEQLGNYSENTPRTSFLEDFHVDDGMVIKGFQFEHFISPDNIPVQNKIENLKWSQWNLKTEVPFTPQGSSTSFKPKLFVHLLEDLNDLYHTSIDVEDGSKYVTYRIAPQSLFLKDNWYFDGSGFRLFDLNKLELVPEKKEDKRKRMDPSFPSLGSSRPTYNLKILKTPRISKIFGKELNNSRQLRKDEIQGPKKIQIKCTHRL